MPLDRAHVTVASRVMLPTYVAFFTTIGSVALFSSTERLFRTPMLRYANDIMSIRVWGLVFILCAALMVFAMVRHERMLYRYALLVCAFSMASWTLVAIAGIFYQPVSFSAWAWPAFVTSACFATDRSLAYREPNRGD